MKARFQKYELQFKRPAGTSRGVYSSRPVWFLFLTKNGRTGIGECAPLPGLSKETPRQVEQLLTEICANPKSFVDDWPRLQQIPSVQFGLETAWLDLQSGGKQHLFSSEFTEGESGIPINGLIWMGNPEFMKSQIDEKLEAGYRCLKLKIGAINFEKEWELLQAIREKYTADEIILRVDANGAFGADEVLEKLRQLAKLDIHSIEQPISPGQLDAMARLCRQTPLPIALDEELIGITKRIEKEQLLEMIRPQFLILKPSLHGGLSGCDEWIELANSRKIGWWITSYLESNIGLNAIAQWAFTKNVPTHQGLGTGQLFTNNFDSPLEIRGEKLWFNSEKRFAFPEDLVNRNPENSI